MILAILALIILTAGAAGLAVAFDLFGVRARLGRHLYIFDAVFIGAACALALATLWAVAA